MTQPAPPDGTGGHALVTLDGRYHIVERIASGGMGEVFRARDAVLDREVAIKVLHRSLAGDQAFVDRFRREARAAAGLAHPNIVAVYDWGSVDGIYYMVMEHVRGNATRELLNGNGRLEPAQTAEVVRQTLLALEHAHRQGIVHRDVKPENILIAAGGIAKVADFGLARAFAEARQTRAGTVTGTVQYLAPEQIRGEPADPRSDLYSLGVVTYELLTGRLPFAGETAMSIAYQHLSDRVPRPSARVPSIPAELDGFVASATDRDREMRPESASEMRRDLQDIAGALAPARSLAALVADMPEARPDPDGGEITDVVHLEAESPTTTATITHTDRPPRRRWRRVLGAMVVLGVLVASAWGVWTYAVPHRSSVPGVVGTPWDQARTRLADAGFAVREAPGQYSKLAEGRVLDMQPNPGSVVERGATVYVVVSLGPPPVDVPTVEGKPLQAARKLITNAGLRVAGTRGTFDFDVEAGSVLSQRPAGGTLPRGSEIRLVISRGPPPVAVPDVAGKTQETATAQLRGAAFAVSATTDFSDTMERGHVISSSPAAGVAAPYGSAITIVVSQGPETFPAPDFGGLSVAAAKELAARYGLTISALPVPGATGSNVVSQLPPPGQTVRYGTTVTVYYL